VDKNVLISRCKTLTLFLMLLAVSIRAAFDPTIHATELADSEFQWLIKTDAQQITFVELGSWSSRLLGKIYSEGAP
jgi:hypothetical protein